MTNNLCSATWLEKNLDAKHISIIDASWHLPATKRDARAEFDLRHIPNAQFYDLDQGADPATSLPHMLPSAAKFAADMSALEVREKSRVIVYDSVGMFSAARLWWMLKSFGHRHVSVLNGGLRKWVAEGRPVTDETPWDFKSKFKAHLTPGFVSTLQNVKEALSSGTAQIADARSPARFRGEEPEPRAGVRPGHMPGALNVHYATLLKSNGTLKDPAELQRAFEFAGIDLSRPIITSCGSGVTAAILILALEEIGHQDHTLYDGSWAEWGASDEAVETG